MAPGLANWTTDTANRLTRPLIERVAGIHRDAALPDFHRPTFVERSRRARPARNTAAPGADRKAALYATCFVNYNDPAIGVAAEAVLRHNGVDTEVVYPRCCAMPQLEQGDLERVAAHARQVAADLAPRLDQGFDVVALTPSCALMLKFEWPLLLPDEKAVARLAESTYDIAEYVVAIARKEGLAPGLGELPGGVGLHLACHARAQNIGAKAAEMLRLVPGVEVDVFERCSGHGGSWGVMRENFEVALKVGRVPARRARESAKAYLASECPLAGTHLLQAMARLPDDGSPVPERAYHPIELFAKAYGLV